MGKYRDKNYEPGHKRGTVLIVLLALLLAVLTAACIILAQSYFEAEPPEAPPDPPPAPSSEPEPEPEPVSVPVPDVPVIPAGEVPESAAVDQAYFEDAAFFGDSITSGIGVYAVMSNADVIAVTGANPVSVLEKENYSAPGSEERMTMIEALRLAAPKKIYIQLGANWVGEKSGVEEETFITHYRTLLERIRQEHPESVIYVQSMFPVSRAYDTNENGKNTYGLTNALIRTFNEALHSLAVETGNYYLDLYGVLCNEEGYLPEEDTSDGMHLKAEYYELWFDYLKTHTVRETEPEEGAVPGGESAAPDVPGEGSSSPSRQDPLVGEEAAG